MDKSQLKYLNSLKEDIESIENFKKEIDKFNTDIKNYKLDFKNNTYFGFTIDNMLDKHNNSKRFCVSCSNNVSKLIDIKPEFDIFMTLLSKKIEDKLSDLNATFEEN